MHSWIKMVGVGVLALSLGTVSLNAAPISGQAKVQMTDRTLHKSIRGTWWHYDGKGHYGKIVITPKQIKTRHYESDSGWSTNSIHIHSRKASIITGRKIHSSWGVIFSQGKKWGSNVRGWNQNAGYGDFYKRSYKRVNGKKVRVLTVAEGVTMSVWEHDYPTKKLAKQFKNSHEIF